MDDNSKIAGDGGNQNKITVEERNPNSNGEFMVTTNSNSGGGDATESGSEVVRSQTSSRTPFTNLSQEDADLALARTLQEQERAYMVLSMGEGIGYGRWDIGPYVQDDESDGLGDSHAHTGSEDNDEDEDAFDVHAHTGSEDNDEDEVELDPSAFPDDEAYARALQDAEERDMAARLMSMAGISEREVVDAEVHRSNSQDTWEEVNPDELSYEELIALGEVVGTESRGLSADIIASLPSTNYKSENSEEAEADSCVICRLDYEDEDALTTLPCEHLYHSDCINNWLKINKTCPVCSAEVSTSGNS